MDIIIIIDDNGIQQELQDFLLANKNHIRLSSDMEQLSLSTNPLLQEIINRYEEKHKIKIRSKDKVGFYRANDIIRFEAVADKTRVYLSDHSQNLIEEDITSVEMQLQDFPFLRVHADHMINLHFLSKISKENSNQVELTDGSLIPVTHSNRESIIEFLNKYFK